jgi:hypothetical protein
LNEFAGCPFVTFWVAVQQIADAPIHCLDVIRCIADGDRQRTRVGPELVLFCSELDNMIPRLEVGEIAG